MSRHYSIKRIHIEEFPTRPFPLVLIAGKPAYVINQWIFYLLEKDISESLLEERIRSVMHLFEFSQAKYGEQLLSDHESQSLVRDFLFAKKNGTLDRDGFDPLGLYWKPLPRSTIKRYLKGINEFDQWQATFHGAQRLNPAEERVMEAWEIYNEFQARTKWDALLHLFPSKQHVKTNYRVDLGAGHSRFNVDIKRFPKAFPLTAFVDLVEKSPNPRDKMLWLLMFGIGLRQSETLHIYLEDCYGLSNLGETLVRLDDPECGEFLWTSKDGKQIRGTRGEYLATSFRNQQFRDSLPQLHNLAPRSVYGGNGGLRSGFKGMHFDSESNALCQNEFGHTANWLDPRLGIYFNKCLNEYLGTYFYQKPKSWPFHPFLFINLDNENMGLPLTLPALKKSWRRALRRIGLDASGLGPHSLRHLAGYYCANVLELSMETTKSLLRHKNVSSTNAYYHLSQEQIRNIIFQAVNQKHQFSAREFVGNEHKPKLDLPEHWYR